MVVALLTLALGLPVLLAAQSADPGVFITGHVRNPGSYVFKEGMTAGALIVMAGGLTERGDPSVVSISRKGNGKLTQIGR